MEDRGLGFIEKKAQNFQYQRNVEIRFFSYKN